MCMAQGGRLYQPRSTRTLQFLKKRSPEFFDPANTLANTILSWNSSNSLVALGITTDSSDPSYPLTYRDGSELPTGLSEDTSGLTWSSPFPAGPGNTLKIVQIH